MESIFVRHHGLFAGEDAGAVEVGDLRLARTVGDSRSVWPSR